MYLNLLYFLACASPSSDISSRKPIDTGKNSSSGQPVQVVPQHLNKEGYDAVLIRGGSFMMGCPQGDDACEEDEQTVHKVTISRDFYMMKSEVTQGLYMSVMGENPSNYKDCGSRCPVENVNWLDAIRLANKLSKRDGLVPCYETENGSKLTLSWSINNEIHTDKDCRGWRLPTEAEWEYAARGGEAFKYSGSNDPAEVSWYEDNSGSKTHPVCTKKENGFGLCDMSGNVWEWVWDNRYKEAYKRGDSTDPVVNEPGPVHMQRGGGCYSNTALYNRLGLNTSTKANDLGFRLLRTIP